jgi:hypothetical protein
MLEPADWLMERSTGYIHSRLLYRANSLALLFRNETPPVLPSRILTVIGVLRSQFDRLPPNHVRS